MEELTSPIAYAALAAIPSKFTSPARSITAPIAIAALSDSAEKSTFPAAVVIEEKSIRPA